MHLPSVAPVFVMSVPAPESFSASSPPPSAPPQQLPPSAEQMVQWMHHMQSQLNGMHHQPAPNAAPRLERPKPPPMVLFTGQKGGSGFAIDDWLREVDKQFEFFSAGFTTDASKIRHAVLWLSGDAQTWWENEDQSTVTTWAEFVKRVRERYRPHLPAELARQRLRVLKQRGRVDTYINEFLKLVSLLPRRDEADRIFDFKEGLDRPLASKVAEGKPKTLQEAMEMAVQAEPYVTGRTSSGFQFRSGHSFRGASSSSSGSGVAMDINAVGVGEESKDDVEADTGADHTIAALMTQVDQLQQRLNSIQQSPSSRGYQRAGAPKSSRVSGRSGADISRMMKEGRCFLCGNKGHMKNECPQQPKNL